MLQLLKLASGIDGDGIVERWEERAAQNIVVGDSINAVGDGGRRCPISVVVVLVPTMGAVAEHVVGGSVRIGPSREAPVVLCRGRIHGEAASRGCGRERLRC